MKRNIVWGEVVAAALMVGCSSSGGPTLPTTPTHVAQVEFLARYPNLQVMALTLSLEPNSTPENIKLRIALVHPNRTYSDIAIRGGLFVVQGGVQLVGPVAVGSVVMFQPGVKSGSWDVEWRPETVFDGTSPSIPCPPLCGSQRTTEAPLLVGGSVRVF